MFHNLPINSNTCPTLEQDGKFRVFAINVDYQIGQDPSLAVSGAVEVSDIDSKIRFRIVLLLCCWTLGSMMQNLNLKS